ncbi:MAG: substrate-binding domain-containing protein [Clostridia bacterium]|nr:substrate-binding domain-containing protein [Clostridia bacterium]
MLKSQDTMRVTLIVHSRLAMFEWGRTIIDIFTAYAIKNKYVLTTVCDADEVSVSNSPVVILGVDSEWLNSALEKLSSGGNKIILIYGIAHENYEHVSHITADQQAVVQKSLKLLREQGRTRPAFFGVQKNDSSDKAKALLFSEHFPSEDVYPIESTVEECYERLQKNLERYDSIICSNDVMAIYLLARFRTLGIDIPQRLHLIGNGNLWLSAHVTPPITTVAYNYEVAAKLALQMCENFSEFEDLGSVNVSISNQLVQRGSTGKESMTQDSNRQATHKRGAYISYESEEMCRELSEIVLLDRALSTCSEDQVSLLRSWIYGDSVESIAEKMFISVDTVKYHLKVLYKMLGIHSKAELNELVDKYGLTL